MYYSLSWIAQIYELSVNHLSPCKELMTQMFFATPNTNHVARYKGVNTHITFNIKRIERGNQNHK